MRPGPHERAEAAFLEYVGRRQEGEQIELDEFVQGYDTEVRVILGRLIEDYEHLRVTPQATPGPGPLRFGDYDLLHELGRGASAVVWEAVERGLNRRVALKRLHPVFSFSNTSLSRFLREARAAAGLDHPGIIRVYATGDLEGVSFISQELVAGGRTLNDWLGERRKAGPLDSAHDRDVARICMLVADALACAHGAGVVHRDLKPSNILLTPEGMPKVADFGLALVEGDPTITRTNDIVGTYAYMSPEQVQGERQAVDRRSDIFALGTILHELLTGARPFREQSALELRASICEDRLRDPRARRSDIRAPLAAICIKALRRNPTSRYQEMSELSADLRAFLNGRSVSAHTPGALQLAWFAMLERPRLTLGFAGLIASTLVSITLVLFINRERGLAEFESRLSSELLQMSDELHLPERSKLKRSRIAELSDEIEERLDEERRLLALRALAHTARDTGDTRLAISLLREVTQQDAILGLADTLPAREDLRILGWCLSLELRYEEAAATYETQLSAAGDGSLEGELLHAYYLDALIQGRLEDRLLAYLGEYGDPRERLASLNERLSAEKPDRRRLQVMTQTIEASYLYRQGGDTERTKALVQRCFDYCSQFTPLDDPLRLRVMMDWSTLMGTKISLGQAEDLPTASGLLDSAAGALAQRFGPEHPLTALAYFKKGRALLERVLSLRQQGALMSTTHPSNEGALEQLIRETLDSYSRAQRGFRDLGPNHSLSLLLRHHLLQLRWARLLDWEGSRGVMAQRAELEAASLRLAQDFDRALGPMHSDSRNCWRWLAQVRSRSRREALDSKRALQRLELLLNLYSMQLPRDRWKIAAILYEQLLLLRNLYLEGSAVLWLQKTLDLPFEMSRERMRRLLPRALDQVLVLLEDDVLDSSAPPAYEATILVLSAGILRIHHDPATALIVHDGLEAASGREELGISSFHLVIPFLRLGEDQEALEALRRSLRSPDLLSWEDLEVLLLACIQHDWPIEAEALLKRVDDLSSQGLDHPAYAVLGLQANPTLLRQLSATRKWLESKRSAGLSPGTPSALPATVER